MSTKFMSYVAESLRPKTLARLCLLGVDIVGVPVLLLYGLPENKVLVVLGWYGLRMALSGLSYLESDIDKPLTKASDASKAEAERASHSAPLKIALVDATPIETVPTELPASKSNANEEAVADITQDTPPTDQREPMTHEAAQIEFPRTEGELTDDAVEGVSARTTRSISLSSSDSGTTWSECQTPPQTVIELPAESDHAHESLETPRPDGVQWFSKLQDEMLAGTDTPKSTGSSDQESAGRVIDAQANVSGKSSPGARPRRPPTRKSSSKYGSCPLVPKRSNPSLQVSSITFDKPQTFAA
ncbi:hypothetical protein BDV93DRAFT_556746 [Ceratobasidium sp. AG-I]|nr:hypothetical protein BDV93DRAFT_556746 [Ceratobasidium sp. AG-I]